ncbi:hypothetical protein EQG41_19645 [Billgrantia azerbaijanica]|nr:hypothetical protein EQG41_19645 [Halomonas azerbaijanica]
MADVTHLNRWQAVRNTGALRGEMTDEHHAAIARIQRLAVEVSQLSDHFVYLTFHGHVNELDVAVTPYAHCEPGNYRRIWGCTVHLPPSPHSDPDCLDQLTEIIDHLEGLLPQPGGAA